jgi:hypothetical protein
MADPGASAWQRIARELANTLPGEWTTGLSGAKTVLVSRPDEWILWWIGLDRVRRNEPTYLVAGAVELAAPFVLTYRHGLRSDATRRKPNRVDLLSDDAERWIRDFVVEDAIPALEAWPRERMKQIAEDDLADPPEQRAWPLVAPFLAGWRVVEDSGSPAEPAEHAIRVLATKPGTAAMAAWYQALLDAWKSGGRPAALTFLQDQRAATLATLNLAQR